MYPQHARAVNIRVARSKQQVHGCRPQRNPLTGAEVPRVGFIGLFRRRVEEMQQRHKGSFLRHLNIFEILPISSEKADDFDRVGTSKLVIPHHDGGYCTSFCVVAYTLTSTGVSIHEKVSSIITRASEAVVCRFTHRDILRPGV